MPTPGSTKARGYDQRHKDERARWAPVIAAGHGWCAEIKCIEHSRWIPPGSAWDLAHDEDRRTYRGPAHRRCNRSEGATRGNRQRRRVSVGQWRSEKW